MLFNSFKSVIQFYLKSCTINYWFHQIHRGWTVLLSKEQIGKCESLFLTAEILSKTGKIYSGKTDSKRRKKGWILDKLSTFPASKYHLFLCNLKLTENWQEQYKGLADRLDPDSWITGVSPVCFIVVPPSCLLPFFPPCFPAFGGLLETFAPLPLNTSVYLS